MSAAGVLAYMPVRVLVILHNDSAALLHLTRLPIGMFPILQRQNLEYAVAVITRLRFGEH
jgi:hypothetical protein